MTDPDQTGDSDGSVEGAARSGRATTLVIAYAFAPDADTSAVAATKRVAVQGEPVDVISHRLDSLRPRDPSLEELVARVVQRHARVGGPTSFGGWKAIQAFCSLGEGVLHDWTQDTEDVPYYSSLYTRAHFIASPILGALVADDQPGMKWRAEVSDPLARKATGEPRPGQVPSGRLANRLAEVLASRGVRMPDDATTFQWAETLTYAVADEVIFTSTGQRDYCTSLIEDVKVRRALELVATVEPHATLPSNWYSVRQPPLQLEPDRCHIGYFGGFYASQDPAALFRAVAGIPPGDRDRLRIHLFTGPSDKLHDAIAVAEIGDVVLVRDRLPFLDFLAATRQMDLLLAIDAAPVAGDSAPHVRLSKMSDYLGSGTQIWGVVTPGSDLAAQPLKYQTPAGHVTGLMQVLASLARQERPAVSHPQ